MRDNEIAIYRATFNQTGLTGGFSVQIIIEIPATKVTNNPHEKAWELFPKQTGIQQTTGWRLFHLIGCVGPKTGRDKNENFCNTNCTCKSFPDFCQMHGPLKIHKANPRGIGLGPCDGEGEEI